MSHGFTFKGFSGSGDRLVAFTNATGQTASIGSTTLFTAPAAGFYRFAAYAVVSASALGGTLGVAAGWNDGVTAQSSTMFSSVVLSALGQTGNEELEIWVASGQAITYNATLTGLVGATTYNAYFRLESLG